MPTSAPAPRPSVDLQDRDLELLLGLFESRVMTVHHAAALHFGGRLEAARKRVQKLKAAGYVAERPRRATDPAVYFLTKKAFVALLNHGMLSGYPRMTWPSLEKRVRVSELTLRHELDVMDLKAALTEALRASEGFEILEFGTWPALYEFPASGPAGRPMAVRPDGFLHVRELGDGGSAIFDQFCYLEVDRSTEQQELLAQRAACYQEHYRRGGLAARYGRPRAEFKTFPFRVLMTFRTAERRNNAAERMLLGRPPVLTMVWMTTLPELVQDPLGRIWVRPQDYLKATEGTLYDPTRPRDPSTYRRQADRERLVERAIHKHALLKSDHTP